MQRRHPLPRPPFGTRALPQQWLMTDERMGEALWAALERLPRGGGVVFRHYATPVTERRALFARVLRVAQRRRLVLVRAGKVAMRGEMGVHNARGRGLRTRAVHDPAEAMVARRAGADAVFVSPVFATRSHAGARGLGVVRLGLLLRGVAQPAVAMGGIDAGTIRRLRGLGVHGWAGIDAWLDHGDG
ncbi:thiamine phosphate synthase [Sphingomonas qomolangmaensis]|uniref:Thiamine phosphate synthase n=1 Tax=Sphingomonas qomolangmaensis TaxID=2918765 RepID=A0ABY5LB44_9SPHN|nr:thiamine phosphate synthase [Sphingomonas qomolangmaensis]UUL81916.1 thiamine phosphate synthase [Sphingomonas qomolangmaensis]